jgi:hypothetical protein
MVPIGLWAGYSLEPAHGFTALMAFMVTLTTALTLTTGTADHCQGVEKHNSTIFMATKPVTDKATQAMPAMMLGKSMRCLGTGVAEAMVVAAGVARR